jgi:hypothetical protein
VTASSPTIRGRRLGRGWSTTVLALQLAIGASAPALAQTEPLPSWNDGPAKQSLVSSSRP